ncbi:hypothetical protein GTO87_02745 [Ligilactobacillus saerimneri]|uniref:Uncharacterized protein n=1 Tax=Ligilactobacillus saerimneri TaxID=228229 RepID=A0A7H9EJI6_9LACO|nr:hypothetical protein [Ligilactobacillus saerimneri]QLL77609.1 hypothetical protein GTO87_02745 [Ligilactobacillus saerimneri]
MKKDNELEELEDKIDEFDKKIIGNFIVPIFVSAVVSLLVTLAFSHLM